MGRPGKYGRILLWLFCFCLVANGLWAAGVSDSDTFKIFFGETKVLTGEDINRVLSSDSTIVSARLRSASELEILGNALGTTFVSYWDKTGRHTFRVIVSQMITEPSARPKEAFGGWFSDFSLGYSGSFNQSSTHYYQTGIDYTTSLYNHYLSLGTVIPLGRLQNYFRFDQMEGNPPRLTDWRAYLYGQGYTAGFGDLSASYSELSIGGVSYQGINFRSNFNGVDYSLDWGARNRPWWGGATGVTPDSYIGLDTRWSNFMGANWELTLGQTRDTQGKEENRVVGILSRFSLNSWDINTELGKSRYGTAFKTEAGLAGLNYHLSAAFRNTGINYQSLGGSVPYVGVIGLFLKGDYKPWERLSLYSSYDYYYNFLSGNPQKPSYPNNNFSFSLGYDFSPWPFASVGYSRGDSQGYLNGGIYDGIFVGLSQPLTFIFRYNGYLRYGKTNNEIPTNPQNSYSSESRSLGLNVAFLPNLTLSLDRSYDFKNYKTGDQSTQRTDKADLSWAGPFSFNPLSLSAGYVDYKSGNVVFDYSQYYGGFSLSYPIGKNLSFSLGGRISESKSSGNVANDRSDKSLFGSVTYVFDTSLGKLPRNLAGVIFEDLNGNGRYDNLEPGLAGVTFILNEKYYTKSDGKGQFIFVNIDQKAASLKMKDSDKIGFAFPFGDTFKVNIDPGETKNVYFAVSPQTALKGFVYEDANNNGIFDIAEKKMVGASIVIDGGRKITSNEGGYYLVGVEPGAHRITVEPNSLPENHSASHPEGILAEIRSNEVKELNIPVLSFKSVFGYFFLDKNGNHQFDQATGEPGVPGVRIWLDDRKEIATNNEGFFILKEISIGPHLIKIKLPPPYKCTREFNLIVEKEAEEKINLNWICYPKYNTTEPALFSRNFRVTSRQAVAGMGPPPAETPIKEPAAGPLKVKFFPAVAKPGQSLKIQVALEQKLKVTKITAVSGEIILPLKYSGKANGLQIWTSWYQVPVNYRSRYLEFKIYARGKRIPETMQRFAVEVVVEQPAKPSVAPAAAEKIIFSETVKLALVSEPVQKGKELKIFLKLPKEVPVEKVTAVFNQTQVTLKKAAGDEQNQLWQGVYLVPPKIKGNVLNFKIFVKAIGYPLFSQGKTLQVQ